LTQTAVRSVVRIGPLVVRRDLFRPRRTIRPTRDGWWCLGAALALGFAAMNTGNNLLYLLASLLLALIIVSGVLSEQSLRRLRLTAVVPDELYAGSPSALGVRVANGKRWLSSYSVMLEAGERRLYIDRLRAGEERLQTWETTFARRGRQRLPGVRVVTRFPFGLFVKTGRRILDEEILVFPAVAPIDAARRRELSGGGARPVRQRGRGHDLYNLRDYRPGDDRRLIHWRSSARTGTLTVRETQAETALDVRLTLRGGERAGERLEAGLSEAASLAAHLLDTGATVELVGRGVHVPPGHGRGHRRRVLTALALYDPGAAHAVPPPAAAGAAEVVVELG
jgi:uncharacterized protein (DUF58 family)